MKSLLVLAALTAVATAGCSEEDHPGEHIDCDLPHWTCEGGIVYHVEGATAAPGQPCPPSTKRKITQCQSGCLATPTMSPSKPEELCAPPKANPADAGTTDAGTTDAAAGDSSTGPTPCGNETCQPTDVCVQCNCGGPTSFTCTAAPAACDGDRACACLGKLLCPEAASCGDQGDNTILCETGMD